MNPSTDKARFNDALLQALATLADEFIAVWDQSGKELIYFNDAYSYFFEYDSREAFQSAFSFFGLRKTELQKELQQLVFGTIKQNGHWSEEVLYATKSGKSFLGRLDISKFQYKDSVYYLQRIINIDTQRIFSENLFKEIKKFEALFQFATLPIVLVNNTGNIILANQQAIALFEYSISEFTELKVEDLIPVKFRHGHLVHRKGYEEQPANRPMGKGMKLSALKKSGKEFPVEISLGHYEIDGEPYVIAFIIDISKRVEDESLLRHQKEELEKVNREIEQLNEELEHKVELRTQELTQALSKERELSDLKSRFVSMASHEFRTPLSTILSSVSLIGKYTATEEQDRRDKHILRIRSAVSNLTDILNEFLSLGKIEEGKIQVHYSDFNLKEQLQVIISEMNPLLKSQQQISYQHSGPETTHLDLSLIRNILINLISNAIKFSPDKATIWVESSIASSSAMLKIRDEGIGISDDDKKHLFERFFRGKNAVNIQGTGLGLHIVSKYIDLMGGTIQMESELGSGTSFTIKFNL
jgi:PAS domain S-box-containing protein